MKTKYFPAVVLAFAFTSLSAVQSVKADGYYLWVISGDLGGSFKTDLNGMVIQTDISGGPSYFDNSSLVNTHTAFPSPAPAPGQNYADFYQDDFVAPNSDGNFDFSISIGYNPSQDALGIFDYDATSTLTDSDTFDETDTFYSGTVTRTFVDITPVPEPAMPALVSLGGLLLLSFGRRPRQAGLHQS